MITYNNTNYAALRLSVIRNVEGVYPAPYLDHKGYPTIGIGFLLRDDTIGPLVLAAFGLDANNPLLTNAGRAREQSYILVSSHILMKSEIL